MQRAPDWRVPIGTFTVNMLGCLVAGLLAGTVERHETFSPDNRAFLFAGLLGGFTTFSAFGLETATLLRNGQMAIGVAYAICSVVLGVAVFWVRIAVVNMR